MLEFVAGILALLMALGVWAAIGHGIWVLIATIGRAIFGDEQLPRTPCKFCKATDGVERHKCRFCGAMEAVPPPPATLAEELRGSLRQLDRLWRRGIINDEEHTRLVTACQNDLQRVLGGGEPVALPRQEPVVAPSVVPEAEVVDAEIVYIHPSVKERLPPHASERDVHPLDRPEPVFKPAPVEPPRAKRALADVLAAFMQERNIRWGELVSGLLIVGSAAGLVLSLRDQLREWIPFFPAFLFLLATSAIHGAGLYTLRKWNLQATSRGVLIISLLLVPLNFLAAILISGDSAERVPVLSATYIAAVTVGLLAFATICITGARALVGRPWQPIALAVFSASASQLLINRAMVADAGSWQILLLGMAASGCFIAAVITALYLARSYRKLSWRRAQPMLLTLGLGGFALLLPLWLLIARATEAWQALSALSPMFALLGATVIAAGLMLSNRALTRTLAPLAVTGTSLAVLGGFVMLAAVGFAWPEPLRLMLVGTLCTVSLGLLAWSGRLPLLQAPAVACAALVSLVALHYSQGRLEVDVANLPETIIDTWLMGRSGLLLTTLAGVVAAVAALQASRKAIDYAWVLLYSAGGLAVLSLFNATFSGFLQGSDAPLATLTFGIYAIALAMATALRPHRGLTVGSAALSLVTVAHGVGFNEVVRTFLDSHQLLPDRPVLMVTLILACVFALLSAITALRNRLTNYHVEVAQPLALAAFGTSLMALWFAVAVVEYQFALHASYVLAIAVVWLVAAVVLRSAELMTAGQSLSLLAIAYAAAAVAQRQTWWGEWSVDPRIIAFVIIAISCACCALAVLRRLSERWPVANRLLAPNWPPVDEVVLPLAVLVVVGGMALLVSCGVMDELRLADAALTADAISQLGTLQHPTVLMAVAALILALIVALWHRVELIWILGLALCGSVICGLFSLRFMEAAATASALRWSLSLYLLILTAVFCSRDMCQHLLRSLPVTWRGRLPEFALHAFVGLMLALTALPIVGVTLVACMGAAQGVAPRGPVPETFFANLGWTVSYLVPLIAVVIALLAIGLRQRHAGFVVVAGSVWQFIVSLGVVMPVLTAGEPWDAALSVSLWQWNAIGMGLFTLLWLALLPLLDHRTTFLHLLRIQIAVVVASLAGLAVWATASIIARAPLALSWPDLMFGSWHSYLAVAIGAAVIAWQSRVAPSREHPLFIAIWSASAVSLAAPSLSPLDSVWPWTSYHALLTAWLLTAAIATALSNYVQHSRLAVVFATLLTGAVVVLSFFSGWSDDAQFWAIGINLGALAVLVALGIVRGNHGFAYATVPLTVVACSQAFVQFGGAPLWHMAHFITANVVAVTCISALWLAVEIERERSAAIASAQRWLPSVPLLISPVLTAVAVIYVAIGWAVRTSLWNGPDAHYASAPASIAMMSLLGAYLLALLWYDRQRIALGCLYAWGLGVAVMCADRVPLRHELTIVALPTVLAVYVALVGWLWHSSALLASFGQGWGIHEPIAGLERTSRWLPPVTCMFGVLLCLADLGLVLGSESLAVRSIAGMGPLLVAIALAMQAQLARRASMMYLSLLSASFAAILLGWAELPPGFEGALWLRRSIRLLLVMGALAMLYTLALPRMWNHLGDWLAALRRASITCGVIAGLALIAVLTIEVGQFMTGDPGQISNAEIAVVAVVLGMLSATLVVLAMSPRVALTDPQRMACVYGAQLLLALAFGHLYFTRPQWFNGLLKPYWPYIVMAIAFGGVAIGEWLRRMRVRVLAEPLQRTGAFLPLLPALGWWIEAASGQPTTDYAFVMFVVGLLYVVLSICRTSLISTLAAAVSGNIALWSLMAQRDWSFAERPQFWLIPPALSLLAGVQANHKRLTDEQLTAARYACLLVIYLSSTSEIFINGITSPWPPLVLLALAVAGVLAGMALQVRAFLYVGTSFVFLSMITMVWHAASSLGAMWPWWVFGICVGLAMLVFFGLFEKKRAEITLLVEKLRQWEH